MMPGRFLILPFLLALAPPAVAQDDALPLPEKTDIPAEFSITLCPDESAAREMLDLYHVVLPPPRNHILDTTSFFDGLAATGCVQNEGRPAGVITIEQVLARRDFELATMLETHIAFRGRGEDGTPVIALVDESWNNRLPRTPLERFLRDFTDEGVLADMESDPLRPLIYVCATPAKAQAVIAQMADPDTASDTAQEAAFRMAIRVNACQPGYGSYRITEWHGERAVSCGVECWSNWTALTATDEQGQIVGLLFDASQI